MKQKKYIFVFVLIFILIIIKLNMDYEKKHKGKSVLEEKDVKKTISDFSDFSTVTRSIYTILAFLFE